MKKTLKFIIAAIIALTGVEAIASRPPEPLIKEHIISENILGEHKIKLDSLSDASRWLDEKVIVGEDTVSIIIPDKNYGRYDRGLFNFLVIPKGQWAFGLTASYGEFNTDDVTVLSLLNNLDVKVKSYSLKPSVSYFIGNNQSVGVKFDYTRSDIDLSNLSFDFDEDLSFSLTDVAYYSTSYSAAVNYRYYVGLGPSKRFAIFNEVDLAFGSGKSEFRRIYNSQPRVTNTYTTQASINFSPGLCVFIMDYASFNVSFGVFGVNFTHERQLTDGIEEGSRFSSGANFKFNIFNINFGIAVHI